MFSHFWVQNRLVQFETLPTWVYDVVVFAIVIWNSPLEKHNFLHLTLQKENESQPRGSLDCSSCWISLVCLNLCLGTSGANGEQRQRSACPMATHPPVGAIMGNTEHHSFNFIPSTVPATRYNVIISSRSPGSSDRAVLSRHWGEMQIDFISAVAFLGPPLVTHRLPFQAKIWKSAGNVKPQRDRIKRRVLFTAIAGSRSEILLNATLSASPLWELSIMLLTCAAVFSHWNHAADKNSRPKAADAWFMRGCYLRR